MLNITKQVVQMHSTATEVGTPVDEKSRLAKMLIKMKVRSDQAQREQYCTHAEVDAVRQSAGTAMRTERSDFDS